MNTMVLVTKRGQSLGKKQNKKSVSRDVMFSLADPMEMA